MLQPGGARARLARVSAYCSCCLICIIYVQQSASASPLHAVTYTPLLTAPTPGQLPLPAGSWMLAGAPTLSPCKGSALAACRGAPTRRMGATHEHMGGVVGLQAAGAAHHHRHHGQQHQHQQQQQQQGPVCRAAHTTDRCARGTAAWEHTPQLCPHAGVCFWCMRCTMRTAAHPARACRTQLNSAHTPAHLRAAAAWCCTRTWSAWCSARSS